MSTEEKIKGVMSTIFDVNIDKINKNSSMDNVENWDSIAHMNLVLALEDKFGVIIPDDEAGNITSYQLIKIVVEELTE
jgi:acyl carrier protein